MAVLRMIIGALFMVSGFIKLMQPYQNFLLTVQSYELLNGAAAVWFAKLMPWAEFILGLFLVLGLWLRPVIMSLWAMNTVFIAVIAQAMLRKLPLHDCGCFGDSFSIPVDKMIWVDTVLWFSFMTMAGWLAHTRAWSLDRQFDRD